MPTKLSKGSSIITKGKSFGKGQMKSYFASGGFGKGTYKPQKKVSKNPFLKALKKSVGTV